MREDASIWISIDDREGAYLRVICDEIFGRQNFVGNVAWQRTYSKRGDSQGIPVEVEHILVYSKREGWQPKKLARTEEMDALYKNPDNDPAGRWQNTSAFAPSGRSHQGMVYAIQHPFTGEMLYPTKDACWRYDQNSMLEIMNGWAEYELREIDDTEKRAAICGVGVEEVRKGVKAIVLSKSLEESKKSASIVMKRGQWPRFYFTSGGKGGIRRKTYLSAVGGVPASNLWLHKDVGHTDEAKKEVLKVFDGQSPFATPKPERLIKRVLEIATDEGDLVLDSFLGSGTTTAVAHKMGRRWIGIEMGEHAKTHCAVRMKKVVDGEQGGISKAVKWQGGGGFRYYELGEAILNEDGSLTCDIPFDVMAAHVWFSETKTPYMGGKKSTVLGVHEGTAYALLYNGILRDRSVNGGNVLTRKTLEVIQADLAGRDYEKIVIYGEACRLMAPTLESLKIEFRQTPYDLVTRR
jgi:adenine-specific DNA-methyltransferase